LYSSQNPYEGLSHGSPYFVEFWDFTKEKIINASTGIHESSWRLPIGTFRKLLLMISSRGFGIMASKAKNTERLI
jgi:hypothetical protein